MTFDENESKRIFSSNLRYFLKLNHKKQVDLANYMGVGSGLVSGWCNGDKMPRMDKIQSICNWLGLELSDLLEDKSEKQKAGFYEDSEIDRLAKLLKENQDLHELIELCEKMPPEKLKSLLEFVKLSN
jgi:transcriptional regulator with XRE-family HTH domain